MPLLERLTSRGPKRILALSGGGIRGVITLGYLERIEQILRQRYNNPSLCLSDYFDLIGGTSTGAIIAAALAVGYEVSRIRQLYLELGKYVFGRRYWRRWAALYDSDPLRRALEAELGKVELGDQYKIKTGLCIITKRADTGSTWPLHNHPHGMYYQHNCGMLLSDIIRASAAAPIFFQPVFLDVGRGEVGSFVDGGVSMFNNPTMELLLLATLKGYPFHWSTGQDQLMIVSAGTGTWEERKPVDRLRKWLIFHWAMDVPMMLLKDANQFNQQLLQALSKTPTPWYVDSEVGNLANDMIVPEPLLHYLHYDARIDKDGLREIGIDPGRLSMHRLRDLSAYDQCESLVNIGQRSAAAQVRPEHFPAAFDLC